MCFSLSLSLSVRLFCFLCFWIPACVPLELLVCTSFGFLYLSLVLFVFRPSLFLSVLSLAFWTFGDFMAHSLLY